MWNFLLVFCNIFGKILMIRFQYIFTVKEFRDCEARGRKRTLHPQDPQKQSLLRSTLRIAFSVRIRQRGQKFQNLEKTKKSGGNALRRIDIDSVGRASFRKSRSAFQRNRK